MSTTHPTFELVAMKQPLSAQTQFLSAADVATIVRRLGIAQCLSGMADTIHADSLRWHDVDKLARVASHSDTGVIELMPVSDGTT